MNYCPHCGIRLRSLVDSEPNYCHNCGVRLVKKICEKNLYIRATSLL